MDLHRLAEERSLAYHRAIAMRVREAPVVLERARARVEAWTDAAEPLPHHVRRWREILLRPVAEVCAFLVDPGEEARELRQCTPFAGALTARERWAIWRRVGVLHGHSE